MDSTLKLVTHSCQIDVDFTLDSFVNPLIIKLNLIWPTQRNLFNLINWINLTFYKTLTHELMAEQEKKLFQNVLQHLLCQIV